MINITRKKTSLTKEKCLNVYNIRAQDVSLFDIRLHVLRNQFLLTAPYQLT